MKKDSIFSHETKATQMTVDEIIEKVKFLDCPTITITGGEKEMTIKEQVAAIRKYIEAKGFNYDGSLIENFYLGLKSKPFVILAGTSGTGKTRLVKLFAEAIQAKYLPVPVRPDWSDSSDLFGHKDLNGNFIKGAIIDFAKDAIDDKTTPYILCLDEMNLARVEYYMSDILSAIETRRFENGIIVTDPVVSAANASIAAFHFFTSTATGFFAPTYSVTNVPPGLIEYILLYSSE